MLNLNPMTMTRPTRILSRLSLCFESAEVEDLYVEHQWRQMRPWLHVWASLGFGYCLLCLKLGGETIDAAFVDRTFVKPFQREPGDQWSQDDQPVLKKLWSEFGLGRSGPLLETIHAVFLCWSCLRSILLFFVIFEHRISCGRVGQCLGLTHWPRRRQAQAAMMITTLDVVMTSLFLPSMARFLTIMYVLMLRPKTLQALVLVFLGTAASLTSRAAGSPEVIPVAELILLNFVCVYACRQVELHARLSLYRVWFLKTQPNSRVEYYLRHISGSYDVTKFLGSIQDLEWAAPLPSRALREVDLEMAVVAAEPIHPNVEDPSSRLRRYSHTDSESSSHSGNRKLRLDFRKGATTNQNASGDHPGASSAGAQVGNSDASSAGSPGSSAGLAASAAAKPLMSDMSCADGPGKVPEQQRAPLKPPQQQPVQPQQQQMKQRHSMPAGSLSKLPIQVSRELSASTDDGSRIGGSSSSKGSLCLPNILNPASNSGSSNINPSLFLTPRSQGSMSNQSSPRGLSLVASRSLPCLTASSSMERDDAVARQTSGAWSEASCMSYEAGEELPGPTSAWPRTDCTRPLIEEWWGEVLPPHRFVLRGKNYLKDRRKVIPAQCAFKTQEVRVYRTDAPIWHAAARIATLKSYLEANPNTFFFVVNQQMPMFGKIANNVVLMYRQLPPNVDLAFDSLFDRYKLGEQSFNNKRLKLAFRLHEAPRVVTGTLAMFGGEKPLIISKAMDVRHFVGANYIEVDIDTSYSWSARLSMSKIMPTAKYIVADQMLVIEGTSEDELPERPLGAWRFQHVDFEAIPIDMSEDQLLS